MQYSDYENKFKKIALEKKINSEFVIKCLSYSKTLLEKGLPVIYSVQHFSNLVGYNTNYIKRSGYPTRQWYMYRHYSIPKKSGGLRKISEPLPSLKEIQHRILNNILEKIKINKFAKAYIGGRNIKQHVRYHKGQNTVLTLDITDFFGSIFISKVKRIFQDMGYSEAVSDMLSKISTLKGKLAQGSPCSPYISNIYLNSFDVDLYNYCSELGIKYTRYADDMAFSGDFDHNKLISIVCEKLSTLGLSLNTEKTKLMKRKDQQIISGIIVNQKTQVPKNKRNSIRNTMFYIKKFGLSDHIEKVNIIKANYVKHLLGQINYILYLNPDDVEFQGYKSYLTDVLKFN